MKQVKNVCDNLIRETMVLREGITQLDYILWNYIEHNDQVDKFKEFLEKKLKEAEEKKKEREDGKEEK